MIRANNQAALTTLIVQLHPSLNKILHLQYTTLTLIALILITQIVLDLPLGPYHLLWFIGQIIICLVFRKMVNRFSLKSVNECLNEKGWVGEGRQRVVLFRYIKFICLLFNILGLMQVKQWMSLQSLSYFSICLLQIPLCLLILSKTKQIEVVLKKINRVLNNFDIDFQQQKQSHPNQMSVQQQKQLID